MNLCRDHREDPAGVIVFKPNKAVEAAAQFWVDRVVRLKEGVTDEQISVFRAKLLENLGKPRPYSRQTFEGGSWGYEEESTEIIKNALDAAGISHFCTDRYTNVQITPWYGKPEKFTVWVYNDGEAGYSHAEVIEEMGDESSTHFG